MSMALSGDSWRSTRLPFETACHPVGITNRVVPGVWMSDGARSSPGIGAANGYQVDTHDAMATFGETANW